MSVEASRERLEKLDRVIEAQRRFLHRIPDPDTRDRAESHLHMLVDMREEVACACGTNGAETGSDTLST